MNKLFLILSITLTLFAEEKKIDPLKKIEILNKKIQLLNYQLQASQAQTNFLVAQNQSDSTGKQLNALIESLKTEFKCNLDGNLDCVKESENKEKK